MKDFQENTRTKSDFVILWRILKYLKPFKKQLLLAISFMILVLAVELLPPIMMKQIIDTITSKDLESAYKTTFVIIIAVGYVVVLGIGNTLAYHQTIILQRIGQQTVLQLRNEVFAHIEKLSIGQINEVPVGKLVTRVTNDTNSISEMYTTVIVNLARNILHIIVVIIIMLVTALTISLYIFITIPIAILATVIFRYFSRRSNRILRRNVSNTNAFLAENLSGIKLVQVFNQEEKKKSEFEKHSRSIRNSFFRQITTFATYRPIIYMISILGMVACLYFGSIEELSGAISYGVIYMLFRYTDSIFRPLEEVSEQFNVMQDSFSSAEKVFDVLDTIPDITDDADAIELEEFKGLIEFRDVWFSYVPDEWVLKGVSFTVKPGQTVAFVGATGSGKTTILSLIVRNYEIQKGSIFIDGIDIKKIKRSSLRSHIGQMLQDVFLFNATVFENITLKDETISKEEVIEAAKYVGADGFINELPDRYNHIILERGNNFSTGQRQLLSFARTLVYKPSLMILDEATANIDSESEEIIQNSLKKMMSISTMLIVAHRLSTIQHSDIIMVMQKGEIKESGTHQELLNKNGIYHSLYQLQYEE